MRVGKGQESQDQVDDQLLLIVMEQEREDHAGLESVGSPVQPTGG